MGLSDSDFSLLRVRDWEDSLRMRAGLLTAVDVYMKLNSTSKSCSLIFLNGMRNFWSPPTFFKAIGITYSYITFDYSFFDRTSSLKI